MACDILASCDSYSDADDVTGDTILQQSETEYDASGQKLRRPRLVDLASRPLLYVTKPVDERDLVKTG